MDSQDGWNQMDLFHIYRRFCDIRSGRVHDEEQQNEDDDGTQRSQYARDTLAQLLNFVELRVHARILLFDELLKLMKNLDLMVDFSEFSRFYDFVFFMCRENGQKSITVSKAIGAWRLVLGGRFRLLNQWCEFVQKNQRHNISEDTWLQVLAFSRCVHENLEGYDPEGAWPVLIDDFVDHMYRASGSNKDRTVFCNCGDSEIQSHVFEDPLPGLKISSGLKRKQPSFINKEMDLSTSLVPDFNNMMGMSSKRNKQIFDKPWKSDDNASLTSSDHCMDIGKPSSPRGSSCKSPCAVEGCLSKGFAGLFSTGSYLQLDESRVSYSHSSNPYRKMSFAS